MRLTYFVQYFPPEQASGLAMVTDLLEGFAARGWDVVCYTPTPTRGVSAAVRREVCRHRTERRCDGRLTIRRMPLWREGTGFLQRMIRYCVFSLQCFWKSVVVPADVIFTGSGPPTQGVAVGLARKLTRKRFVYNLQDIFPDSLVHTGMCAETSVLMKIGRRMERFTYRSADTIITVSDDMRDNVLRKGVPAEKVHVVRNWIDTDAVRPVPQAENRLIGELGLPRGGFCVTYAGNLGMAQGIGTLVEAAELLREREDIRFVIFGGGSEEAAVRAMIRDRGLDNVSLFPLQPMERVPEVYSLGDVSLVACRRGTGGAGMPSKTASILACGRPVLASFDTGSELCRILQTQDCGVCVPPEDPAALASAIERLAAQPDAVARMGANARAFAERSLSRAPAVAEYIRLIEQMMRT